MDRNLIFGTPLTVTLAQNSTGFTTPFLFTPCNGYAGAKVTVSAGSVTISQQCAENLMGPFFDPVDNTNTALSVVATTMGAGTRWVQFNPTLCNFARYKCIETNVAACTVTITHYHQEGC